MAAPGPKVDYSQYQSWEPVQMPSGAVYYIVPGGSGWAYDPFTSSQTGRVQLFRNPKPQLEAEAKAAQEQADAIKKAKEAASPVNQFLQMAGPVAMSMGTKYVYDNWINPTPVSAADKLANAKASMDLAKIPVEHGGTLGAVPEQSLWEKATNFFTGDSGAAPASAAAQSFASGAIPYSGQAAATQALANTGLSEIAPYSSGAIESLAQGGMMPSSTAAAPGWLAQAPGTSVMGSTGLGSMLPGFGIAAGAAVGLSQLGGLKDMFSGRKLKTKEKFSLALPTFGLSLISNSIPGFTHKSIKERQKERWGELAEKGVTGAQEAFALSQNLGDLSGKIASGANKGKEWNWEDAVTEAKIDPGQFRGVYGNFDTFGNDWATYNPAQQDEIIRRLIDNNLYDPEKGDVMITDKEAARKIKDQVLSNDPLTSMIKPPNPQDSVKPPSPTSPVPSPGLVSTPTPTTPGVVAPPADLGFKPLSITPAPVAAPAPTQAQVLGQQLAERFNRESSR